MALSSDQKRALGLAAGGIVAFVAYRRYQAQKAATGATAATQGLTNAVAGAGQQGSIVPYTPQSPITLSTGESVYDPNSGALLGPAQYAPAQTVAPSSPGYVVNVNYPAAAKAKPTTRHKVKPRARPKTTTKRKPVA